MKKLMLSALSLFLTSSVLASPCPKPWVCEDFELSAQTTIRTGHWKEKGTFKGNILYFEGLGDSMVNHSPLFDKLSRAGYRIIAFDYPGQGGSTGKMNNTRIKMIPNLGKIVWKRFARDLKNFPDKTIIGWSTGGLAAYLAASRSEVDRVILLAPGIVPNTIVGGGLHSWPINEITMESLTTAKFAPSEDPHLEPIRPNSPVKVPLFAVDLLKTAAKARGFKIPSSVKGLVLLSGKEDNYVDAEKTRQVLLKNAPHFQIRSYAGARHEIDNERRDIRNSAHQDILNFLLR